ncbi:MAG: hypothetical protein QOJ96_3155 [Alphaproteobacteria bacterium]|nr:hypothetical protein [Alphaproteobacteria bacterium]
MIVLAFGLLAGCGSVPESQEPAPIRDRVRSEKEVETLRGVTWRPEVLESFKSCASRFDLDGSGRRAVAFVDDWLAAAKSLDECDAKNMELITNFYSRTKNLLGTAYGDAQGEGCNKARVDLLVDVDGVANTLASRLSKYERHCRSKVTNKQAEDLGEAFERKHGDWAGSANDYINRRPLLEK